MRAIAPNANKAKRFRKFIIMLSPQRSTEINNVLISGKDRKLFRQFNFSISLHININAKLSFILPEL
jgi:hypothetical protein